jgi:hypothetical protein
MNKAIFILLLLLTWACLPCFPCDCFERNIQTDMARADVVFFGRKAPSSQTTDFPCTGIDPRIGDHFEVLHYYAPRGMNSGKPGPWVREEFRDIDIINPKSIGCVFPSSKEGYYLIFAKREGPNQLLRTNFCTHSRYVNNEVGFDPNKPETWLETEMHQELSHIADSIYTYHTGMSVPRLNESKNLALWWKVYDSLEIKEAGASESHYVISGWRTAALVGWAVAGVLLLLVTWTLLRKAFKRKK